MKATEIEAGGTYWIRENRNDGYPLTPSHATKVTVIETGLKVNTYSGRQVPGFRVKVEQGRPYPQVLQPQGLADGEKVLQPRDFTMLWDEALKAKEKADERARERVKLGIARREKAAQVADRAEKVGIKLSDTRFARTVHDLEVRNLEAVIEALEKAGITVPEKRTRMAHNDVVIVRLTRGDAEELRDGATRFHECLDDTHPAVEELDVALARERDELIELVARGLQRRRGE